MLVRSSLAISVLVLAACNGMDAGGTNPDAPRMDAQTAKVMEVTCPANPAVTFLTQEASFNPATATITMGQIVKLESNRNDHPIGAIPADPQSDPALAVPALQTKCFNFLVKGTFKFQCKSHGYVGMLTVN